MSEVESTIFQNELIDMDVHLLMDRVAFHLGRNRPHRARWATIHSSHRPYIHRHQNWYS